MHFTLSGYNVFIILYRILNKLFKKNKDSIRSKNNQTQEVHI